MEERHEASVSDQDRITAALSLAAVPHKTFTTETLREDANAIDTAQERAFWDGEPDIRQYAEKIGVPAELLSEVGATVDYGDTEAQWVFDHNGNYLGRQHLDSRGWEPAER